jgi:hypothetical protein
MTAYEFYYRDAKGVHLIGILPERRKSPERINQESIMRWVRMVLGNHANVPDNDLFFIQVEV